MSAFGYNDRTMIRNESLQGWKKAAALTLGIIVVTGFWLLLTHKLIWGEDWISATYDHDEWRTNVGNLPTYGAWDLEAHIWKSMFIQENFPNFHWNPYWYMGMPLLKYYQPGFYIIHAAVMAISDTSPAKAATVMIIGGHLLATILLFIVCYKVSKRVFISTISAIFLLSSNFVSLRSYGWEPITVIFMFLYPLGLLIFLKEPLKPFRFWLIIVLGLAFISHPLIWFSLLMFMGLYLFAISLLRIKDNNPSYLYQYFGVALLSILIGAVQFIPQISYTQVTSGAHMGLKYLPFYHVPPNIISPLDFFFNAGDLKGPGIVMMIAIVLMAVYFISTRIRDTKRHIMAEGIGLVVITMILFYYMELYNIFPMNLIRSIQYHRIIPEFIMTASLLVAAMANVYTAKKKKAFYYSLLSGFFVASGIIIFLTQTEWETTDSIADSPEFIYDTFEGRISFPYVDQSLSVRSSFTHIPQIYGYYEQGITNAYTDEIFSVSSGFHDINLTMIYLEAAVVSRLYVNHNEGEPDMRVMEIMNESLPLIRFNERYSYYEIPLHDASFAQAISNAGAAAVKILEPGCRVIYREEYCGSEREEFVTSDPQESGYLEAYNILLREPYHASADIEMQNPDHYRISVKGADENTAIVVKMTFDNDFSAHIEGREIQIEKFGPDFMLIYPELSGDYEIELTYSMNRLILLGLGISLTTILLLAVFFIARSISYMDSQRRADLKPHAGLQSTKSNNEKRKNYRNYGLSKKPSDFSSRTASHRQSAQISGIKGRMQRKKKFPRGDM